MSSSDQKNKLGLALLHRFQMRDELDIAQQRLQKYATEQNKQFFLVALNADLEADEALRAVVEAFPENEVAAIRNYVITVLAR